MTGFATWLYAKSAFKFCDNMRSNCVTILRSTNNKPALWIVLLGFYQKSLPYRVMKRKRFFFKTRFFFSAILNALHGNARINIKKNGEMRNNSLHCLLVARAQGVRMLNTARVPLVCYS